MRNPVVNEFCETLFDGRTCLAKVVAVNNEEKTFDVMTSFKEPMFNIPFEKFKFSPGPGDVIVNSINRDYKLNLYTVDQMDMASYIDGIIEGRKWMLEV